MKHFAIQTVFNKPDNGIHLHRIIIVTAESFKDAKNKLLIYQNDLTKNEPSLHDDHFIELTDEQANTLKKWWS